MAQGTIYLTESGVDGARLQGKVEWQTAANTAANTSTVTAQLYIRKYNPEEILTVPTNGTYSYRLALGDSAVTGRIFASVLVDWVQVAAHTLPDFPHAADGTADLPLTASVTGPTQTSLEGHVTAGSGTVTPDTIPRASAPGFSTDTAVLGQPLTVYTNRLSQDFTCRLTYSFLGRTGTVAQEVADSVIWTPPLDLAWLLPNADSATAVITCHTYRGSSLIGSVDSSLTLGIPEDITPTVTAGWQDTTEASDLFGTPVQNASALRVTVNASGVFGSTLQKTEVTLAGKPYGGQTLLDAGQLPLQVTVTDSRGRTGSYETTLTVIPYDLPTLTLTAHRCDADGTANDMGEYAQLTATGSITALEGNAPTVTLDWGSGSREFTDLPATALVSAPSTQSLPLTATLRDRLYSVTRYMTLSTGYATLDFLAGGKGVSMGKSATREGFDCAMPAFFTAGINGAYLQTRESAGDSLELQLDGAGAVFVLGAAGDTPVQGVARLTAAGVASWSGTAGITCQAPGGGQLVLTLPGSAQGGFVAISATPFQFI